MKGYCPDCGSKVELDENGRFVEHQDPVTGKKCPGVGKKATVKAAD